MGLIHQIHQMERMIRLRGMNCVFKRLGENEFHEPAGEIEIESCKGIFHEANGFLNVSTAESGRIYTKRQPKLLVMYTDTIRKEDTVSVDGSGYKVIGIDDLGNLHLCIDLSLEVV